MAGKAVLVLENGSVFEGFSFGSKGERPGEVVFNTALTGYQEILTDPSYKGQIITMTYPHIGNYGINFEDNESIKPYVEGFIAREFSKIFSNWRAKLSLEKYFCNNNIIAIEGIDTRALTKILRQQGALKGLISTTDLNPRRLLKKVRKWQGIDNIDLVQYVIPDKVYYTNYHPEIKKKFNIVVVDCGIKLNILRLLEQAGMKLTVVPASMDYKQILKFKPDGIFYSNGPGDPIAVDYVVKNLAEILKHKIPVFGICLGHQMLGLALGGERYKLKFGHHGANHPVKNLRTGKVEITSQNHNYCIDIKKIEKDIEITHINLNDNTNEGMRHRKLPCFSVQYHPEASPGPHDSVYLFDEFKSLMLKYRTKK